MKQWETPGGGGLQISEQWRWLRVMMVVVVVVMWLITPMVSLLKPKPNKKITATLVYTQVLTTQSSSKCRCVPRGRGRDYLTASGLWERANISLCSISGEGELFHIGPHK